MKENLISNPVKYALQIAINQFEKTDIDDSKLIIAALKRAEAVWDNVFIHGLEFYGLTYEQFCKQCEKKKNIFFFSDDEVKLLNKAYKIMNIIDD